MNKKLRKHIDDLKVDTRRKYYARVLNVDDFSETYYGDQDLGHKVIYMVFYESCSISDVAKHLSLTCPSIERFLAALNSDKRMQRKYGLATILHGRSTLIIGSSFSKRTSMSADEMEYGENVPKEFLRLGWACPEDL